MDAPIFVVCPRCGETRKRWDFPADSAVCDWCAGELAEARIEAERVARADRWRAKQSSRK